MDVNFGSGSDVLDKSPSIQGYAYLIDLMRKMQDGGLSRDESIRLAVEQCISKGVLVDFFKQNYEEVVKMFARMYSFEEEMEARMEEVEERGMEKGMEKGRQEGLISSAIKMVQAGFALSEVASILGLSSDHVEQVEDAII